MSCGFDRNNISATHRKVALLEVLFNYYYYYYFLVIILFLFPALRDSPGPVALGYGVPSFLNGFSQTSHMAP